MSEYTPPGPDFDRYGAAYHVAGHFVAACQTGQGIHRLSLVPDPDVEPGQCPLWPMPRRLKYDYPREMPDWVQTELWSADARAIASMGGIVAAHRARQQPFRGCAAADAEEVARMFEAVLEVRAEAAGSPAYRGIGARARDLEHYRQLAKQQAGRLLRAEWGSVCLVMNALLLRTTLSTDDAILLYNASWMSRSSWPGFRRFW